LLKESGHRQKLDKSVNPESVSCGANVSKVFARYCYLAAVNELNQMLECRLPKTHLGIK